MGNSRLSVVVLIHISLLHFVASFGTYEYISDCKIFYNDGPDDDNKKIAFICGETDNTSTIYEGGFIGCSYTGRYRPIRFIIDFIDSQLIL